MIINKYSRQISVPFVGITGQEKMNNSKVAIIGAGALGHSTAIYLAASGIGKITIFDHDFVEESNLSRQILFTEQDIGKPKAKCLTDQLKKLYTDLDFQFIAQEFNLNNSDMLPTQCDFIINASDNYKTRHIINLVSIQKNIPWIDIGIFKTQGHFCIFKPGLGCYECLFPEIEDSSENCSLSGVLSPICGIMGSFAANEVVKFILGKYSKDINHYFSFEFLENNFKKFYWKKNSECQYCNKTARSNDYLEKINFDDYFISHQELKIILQTDKSLIVYLNEPISSNYSDIISKKSDSQNSKIKSHFINENIHSILGQNYFSNTNDNKFSFYSNYSTIVFLCKIGTKSKLACEFFRKNSFNCYYGTLDNN